MGAIKIKKKHSITDLSIKEKLVAYFFLFLLSFIMLYPVLLIINISLKSLGEYYTNPIGLVEAPVFANYTKVWNDLNVLSRFFVTLVLSGTSSVITVAFAALAAYPISRMHFKASNQLYNFILASIFFPGSLIANITLMKDILGIYGSPLSLILIWSIGGMQIYTFMFVGFLKQIPRELEEAAVVDGAGYFQIFFRVIAPLLKPIIATTFVLKIIGTWNDFLNPFIYISNPNLRTLATGLYTYMGQFSSQWNFLSSAIVLVALPMVTLYIFVQKYIIEGVAAGAIKG
jgi:raffinose/stachyose/melibiose transport system permease protein